jgi:hypothetical protein
MKTETQNGATLPIHDLLNVFIGVLNSAYDADPAAMNALICNRVPCNQTLADHPTIPVDGNLVAAGESYAVGMLGIINGICEEVTGKRVAVMLSDPPDDEGRSKIVGFTEYSPNNIYSYDLEK